MKKMLSAVLLCSVVIFLLNGICCANNTDSLAFFQMIENNDIRSLQTAIDQGFDINRIYGVPFSARSPLHEAVSLVKPEVVRLLVERGADVNFKDSYDISPIFTAVVISTAPKKDDAIEALINTSIHIFDFLLNSGANINIFNLSGETPLSLAVSGWDHQNAFLISQKLIDAGADPNLYGGNGMPPLFFLLAQSYEENAQGLDFQRADILKLLLDAGADPNHRLSDGDTPLDIAAFSQDAVNILLNAATNLKTTK